MSSARGFPNPRFAAPVDRRSAAGGRPRAAVTFRVVRSPRDAATVRRLLEEYAGSLTVDLGVQGFEEELRALPGPFASPGGTLLLAQVGRRVAGCVALRPGPGRSGELKRLFVRPRFRRAGLGSALLEEIVRVARKRGYDSLVLDTLPEMEGAHRLYERRGFRETAPYGPPSFPGTRYLRLDLRILREPPAGRSEGTGSSPRSMMAGRSMPRKPTSTTRQPASHVRTNRQFWEAGSDEYDRRHQDAIGGDRASAWGLWRVPESSLQLLGRVRGKSILELGCGAARWSIWLARSGARPVGFDATRSQLDKARRLVARERVRIPLVQGNAERLPWRDAAFDVVFCDWGAMTFCDPAKTVPECSRVLRPGGRLVFSTASPLRYVAFDQRRDRQSRRLERSYFDLERVRLGETVEFQLPYGAWIGLFARSGLVVERLLETRPHPAWRSTYVDRRDARWARDWPMEAIWSVRKTARSSDSRAGRSTAR
jgi:ubiquinone/menaquinone biosynthesis C-methylase UbiE/ribosomal protein S18 acetylase RimI-like enzyme